MIAIEVKRKRCIHEDMRELCLTILKPVKDKINMVIELGAFSLEQSMKIVLIWQRNATWINYHRVDLQKLSVSVMDDSNCY